MHKSNFIVAIQDMNGQTLRERGEEVRIPFGSEYQIFLKNQEGRKARVTISINGKDALDGHAFVVDPNSITIINGFMKGNAITHRFKFVQKTEQIVEFQGDNPEHGFIRVEVQFEKPQPIVNIHHYHDYYYYRHYHVCRRCMCEPCCCPKWTYSSSGTGDGNLIKERMTVMNNVTQDNASYSSNVSDSQQIDTDEGLTVAGSQVNESLQYASIGELEPNRTVFTFRMLGINNNGITPIKQPVLTRMNVQCVTCGKRNPTSAQFCMGCGTNLTY